MPIAFFLGGVGITVNISVSMVAAMKGFQGAQGLELAETIVNKIRSAVNKVNFN